MKHIKCIKCASLIRPANWIEHYRSCDPGKNETGLQLEKPVISPCFEETVLVWVPYGVLWIALVPYLIVLARRETQPPLPWSKLQTSKTTLNVILFCLVITEAILSSSVGYRCDMTTPVPSAYYVASSVKAASFLLLLFLELYLRTIGERSSEVAFLYWCLIAFADVVHLYSIGSSSVWCASSTIYCIKFVVIWVQLILRCFADQYNDLGYHVFDNENPCPDETSSALSAIMFHWMTDLVRKCYKETLTPDEIWNQTKRLESKRVVQMLLHNWKLRKDQIKANIESKLKLTNDPFSISYDAKAEKPPLLGNAFGGDVPPDSGLTYLHDTHPNRITQPSLYRILFKTFGHLWAEAVFFKLLGDAVNLLQPLILQKIIDIIESRDNPDNHSPVWMGYAWAVCLSITSILNTLIWQRCLHCQFSVGLTVKTALICTIYRKALTLSNSSKKTSTVGEIVNLMSVDCQRIHDAFEYSHFILAIPFTVTIAMIQIWSLMGSAMFGGLAAIIVVIAVNAILGRWQQRLQREILGLKSRRIKILNEVITGIKVLKMYTWEIPFQKKVTSIRWEEIKRLRAYAILNAIGIMFSVQGPFMIMYGLILVYTLTQPVHFINAQTAFVTLAVVNILRVSIEHTGFVVNGVIQGYVSVGRIQAFLWKDDISPECVNTTDNSEYTINIEQGSFTWNKDVKPTLNKINLKVKEGALYAVVGQVGAGKSSLISAVLGEIEKIEGTVSVKGKFAYVPQEAWIQNMTVRDNIIFGSDWNEDRYNKVLSGCALRADVEMLSGGDLTEIGEKGINISGGQKQRVSLARAIYNDADVYLLDDPLSAVDSHVGKHIFKNVIGPQGLLMHKTRILVTHGIHWLPMVDKIIVLTDGAISDTGTYEQLMSRDGAFANLVSTYLEHDDEENADLSDSRQTSHQVDTSADYIVDPTTTTRRRRQSSHRESFGMTFSKNDGKHDWKPDDQVGSKLVEEESSQEGTVKFAVFKAYAKAMGYLILPFVTLLIIGFQSLNVFSNYWLTYWTEDPLMKNLSLGHTKEYEDRYAYYIVWYTVLGVIQCVAILLFGILSLTRMVQASGILHNDMLQCVLRSPMSFFDTTPVGRIINRFSSDIDIMDDRLPMTFRMWNNQMFATIATVFVVAVNTPIAIVAIVPITIVYLMLLKFFIPTARQTKRMESVLRSPIFNHFSETITGASVIRAYNCVDRFILESEKRVDKNASLFYAASSARRWISVRFECLGNVLILAAAVFALLSDDLNGAHAGLSISYSLQITISLSLVIQAVSDMQINIVSAERVTEYTELAPEAPWTIPSRRPSTAWPRSGSLEFRLYSTRYREGLELALKGISCKLSSGEKVGIVGRTGAGKSSLAMSMFRLLESAGGSIFLDGRNIADMGLHDLRNKLTILPQDPVIFSGTLRENLDPFDKFDDARMWTALECAHLKAAVNRMPGHLNYECGEGGSNLSVGQRQLVCLARTLLHKTRILILDEATASIDLETDELIQATIRTEFSDCTILTIAHRLNTVLDYDRVMVLSEGQIVEIDEPGKLLQNPNSVFFKMARDAGLVS